MPSLERGLYMQGNGTSEGWGDDAFVAPATEVAEGQVRRAVLALGAARQGLWHRPTAGQVRQMAAFGGDEPLSYVLDPAVNYVPGDAVSGVSGWSGGSGGSGGTPGLAFTYRDREGALARAGRAAVRTQL